MSYRKFTRKNVTWKVIFDGIYRKACQMYAEHNQQYPLTTHRRNHPDRIKATVERTGFNLIRSFSRHAAQNIRDGKPFISNAFPTNRRKALENPDYKSSGCSSNASRHFAQLAHVGLILGSTETQACLHEQLTFRHRDQGGKGWGVKPHKNFHGSQRDFELLLNPELLPWELFEALGITVLEIHDFGSLDTASTFPTSNPSKLENFTDNIPLKETTRNEVMSKAASAGADIGLAEGNGCRREREEANKTPAAGQCLFPEKGAGNGSGLSLAQMLQLHQNGDSIEADAHMLVQSYERKLIPAMGRVPYHPKAIAAGVESAKRLLAACPSENREAFVNRLFLTIDRMEQWLKHTRDQGSFVREPSVWFDPNNHKSGILGAEKRFLQVYEQRAKEFEDLKLMRQQRQGYDDHIAKERAKSCDFFNICYFLKLRMLALHPSNSTLRKASLDKWTYQLRNMVRHDGITLHEVKEVCKWLLYDTGENATFWRSGTNNGGIRSIGGLRRNWMRIRDDRAKDLAAHTQAQHKQRKQRKTGKIKSMY